MADFKLNYTGTEINTILGNSCPITGDGANGLWNISVTNGISDGNNSIFLDSGKLKVTNSNGDVTIGNESTYCAFNSGKPEVRFNGLLRTTGNIWTYPSDTSEAASVTSERSVGCAAAAGRIYLYASGTSGGTVGIHTSYNAFMSMNANYLTIGPLGAQGGLQFQKSGGCSLYSGSGWYLVIQGDGNLVLYDPNGNWRWQAKSPGTYRTSV